MDSLVIGLCGEWGCGKTSLKNLIVERLRLRKKRRVDLVEFSPWQMSGHDSISGAFFRELGLKLEKDSDAGSPAAKSAQRLRRYSTAAAFGGAVTRWIGTALRIKDNEAGEIVESAGHALGEVGKVGGQAATAADSVDESREQSLAELKASLSEEMRELDSPVLCVIDDIDRLTSDEIREVFQLVKANADFPNLIFLLLFDRGIVGGALDSVSNGKGDQFLEKIVQVLFHVPQPSLKAVHGALFAGLNRQLDRFDLSETWIQQRWGEVWADGLSEYFHNLRSVYRFLASYTFQVEQFRRKRTSEVNLLDLVVLEVLRLFEPRFYEIIARNKNLFTGVEKRVMFFKEEEALKARKEELEELLKCVEQDRRSRVSRLVENLFPLLGGPPEHDCLEREARVGHSAYFDRYFTLSLSDDDVSQVDLDALRESLTKPRELAEVCERLRRKGLLAAAFSRMDAF
ncbi:MAG: putative KAP-like P-loop ATPase, partial [Limisphaerales bacterium]